MFIVDRGGTFDFYCRGGTIGGRFVFCFVATTVALPILDGNKLCLTLKQDE
jgi:hypothetical protein